jgi:hypothetical protein
MQIVIEWHTAIAQQSFADEFAAGDDVMISVQQPYKDRLQLQGGRFTLAVSGYPDTFWTRNE